MASHIIHRRMAELAVAAKLDRLESEHARDVRLFRDHPEKQAWEAHAMRHLRLKPDPTCITGPSPIEDLLFCFFTHARDGVRVVLYRHEKRQELRLARRQCEAELDKLRHGHET